MKSTRHMLHQITSSSQSQSAPINITEDEVGNLLEKLKNQEKLSQKQQAMLEQQRTMMYAILAQLQSLNKNLPQESQNNSGRGASRSGSMNEEDIEAMDKKIRVAPKRLQMPRKTRGWGTSKPSWMLTHKKTPYKI